MCQIRLRTPSIMRITKRFADKQDSAGSSTAYMVQEPRQRKLSEEDDAFAMTKPIITRFAPSPTGFLHIGGARTALFNWLYARGRGGKMLLRIEDTDRERSTQAAIDAIIDGLKWLGITWDGDTVYQFARSQRHREVAEQLLQAGRAYYCYASP